MAVEDDGLRSNYPVVLHPTLLRFAKKLRDCFQRPDPQLSQKSLLQAYHQMVLAIFTTQADVRQLGPLHSLVDAFAMSISIDTHARFMPPHSISSHLAKVVYAALFSMLTQVIKMPDPYQYVPNYETSPIVDGFNFRAFIDTMQKWIKPGAGTPFCSVRRYTRLCYNLCRSHISLPRLQFTAAHSPEFVFDGKRLSVISVIKMYHAVYRDMVTILHQRLLFGASDTMLQPLKNPKDIVDMPHVQVMGAGVLVSEMDACWIPMKVIMNDDTLRNKYFSQGLDGKLLPDAAAWEEYLEDIDAFKEHFYFLFHQISGMPKRGSEEIRLKLVDTSFRRRNFMYLFQRLACIGDYNKSSRNTGNDKLTLHFLPRPLEFVLRRFQASVATIGAWAVRAVLSHEEDTHYQCYFLSSKGQRWTSPRLSSILQRLSAKHLPGNISLGMNALRHVLPGIAEHYHISEFLDNASSDILHAQLGHTAETGNRMYARGHQDHPQMTNPLVHRTMSFSDLWHELLGFKKNPPDEAEALLLQEAFTQKKESSIKTLASAWMSQTQMTPVVLPSTASHQSLPSGCGVPEGLGQCAATRSSLPPSNSISMATRLATKRTFAGTNQTSWESEVS